MEGSKREEGSRGESQATDTVWLHPACAYSHSDWFSVLCGVGDTQVGSQHHTHRKTHLMLLFMQ